METSGAAGVPQDMAEALAARVGRLGAFASRVIYFHSTGSTNDVADGLAADGADHGAVKVHVGKYTGIELRDLNPEAVQALVEKWLPTAKANAKPTADDRRLIAALEWWATERAREEDNVPY